jgi:Ca-activated chloride channel family protein
VDETREVPKDATRVPVLVTVTAQEDDRGAVAGPGAAEVIIMDCSLSMKRHGKLEEAKRAVAAAIDALPEGTRFAIIAGNHVVRQVHPRDGALARADDRTRREARAQMSHYVADGGTAMSTWIRKADELLAGESDVVRHAVLYTDGINESETQDELDSALRACRDRFVCDVRGVGTDWDHRQLRQIADAMQGRVEAIIDITDLRADFAGLMGQIQRRYVPSVRLRLTMDRRFRLESLHQIRPVNNDLTDRCEPQDGGTTEVPLLAWGVESRDYLLMLRADPTTLPYEEVRAARVDVLADDSAVIADPAAITLVRLRYRDPGPADVRLTTAMDLDELTSAMRAGIDAYERHDLDAAVRDLGSAVAIARRLGAGAHLDRLKRLVDIDEFGEVRLRGDIKQEDLLVTATYAGDHGNVLVSEPGPGAEPGAGPVPSGAGGTALVTRTCPRGHVTRGIEVRFCEEEGCRYEFAASLRQNRGL